jgi:hypothetical protein
MVVVLEYPDDYHKLTWWLLLNILVTIDGV